MSALLEYVHRDYKNYENYGLSRNSSSAKSAIASINKDINDFIDNRIEKNIPKSPFHFDSSNNKKTKVIKLGEILADAGKQTQDFIDKGLAETLEEIENNIKKEGKDKNTAFINYLLGYFNYNFNNQKIVQNFINDIHNKEYQEIREAFYKKTYRSPETTALLNRIFQGKEKNTNKNVIKIDDKSTNFAGLFGEYYAKVILEALIGLQNDTNKIFDKKPSNKKNKSKVIGGEGSSVNITADMVFGENFLKDKKMFEALQKAKSLTNRNKDTWGKDFSMKSFKSQNKTDISISIDGIDLAASVKNYDNGAFHIQKTVNFFYILQYINSYKRLGTHYLNIFASYDKKDDNKYQKHISKSGEETSVKNGFINLIKKEILYEGFIKGNPLKKEKTIAPNLFVRINKNNGDLYIISMKEVWDEITKNPSNFITDENNVLRKAHLLNKNNFRDEYERIAALYNKIEATKFSVVATDEKLGIKK